jgi:outer membrane protein assembly factor BamB
LSNEGSIIGLKRKWSAGRAVLLLALLLIIALAGFSCVRGLSSVGWSGGTVSDDVLYIVSQEGRLVAIDLSNESRKWSEALKPVSQPGLFSCSPATGGGGCGSGTAGVAIYGNPVISGELVYMAGYNGKIYACNIDNLATRWVYPRDSYLPPIVGGLVVDRDKVIFGCSNGKIDNKDVNGLVFALDAITGDYLYSYETGDKIWGTPAVDHDTVYIGSFDKKLYALNISDGSKKWEFTAEGSIIATPLLYQDMIIVGSLDRNLYALKASDGSLKWQFTGNNWFWAEPVIFNDIVYAGCLDHYVYVLKAATGEKIAEIDLTDQISSRPVIVDSSIIFVTRQGLVYSVAAGTNELKQLADIDKGVDGPLTAYNGIVYIHTQDKIVQRINAVDGSVLTPYSLAKAD